MLTVMFDGFVSVLSYVITLLSYVITLCVIICDNIVLSYVITLVPTVRVFPILHLCVYKQFHIIYCTQQNVFVCVGITTLNSKNYNL